MKFKKLLLYLVLSFMIITFTSCNKKYADLVAFGNIYTAEDDNLIVEAFAVKDGKYIYVGDKEGARKYIKDGKTQILDYGDKGLIIPGCSEGHAHYFSGSGLNTQFPGSDKSYEEVLDILENEFKINNIKQFVSFGWETTTLSEKVDQGYNFAQEIESKAPGIPVVLIDYSGHAAVCNETALRLANINKDNHSIRGGNVFLDNQGNPSGYVNDQALYYVVDKAISKPLSDEKFRLACEYGMNELLRLGFTNALDAFTNMYGSTGLYETIKKMDDENEFKINLVECYNIKSYDAEIYKSKVDEAIDIANKYSSKHANPSYIKLFADGVVESSTGWISSTYKYAEIDKKHGNIIWEQEELNNIITYANSKGLTVHTHSYGDGACKSVIDAYLESNKNNNKQYRNCLAHVRNISNEDKLRCANNNIPIAANLIWHTDYGEGYEEIKEYLIDNMGEELYYSGYPMKSLIDKGIILSSSSDAPAASSVEGSILNIIQVATTGVEIGTNDAPFVPGELLSVEETLKALTINGAWQLGLEKERGSIKVGKYADFVIIDTNILNYQGEQLKTIHNAKILYTYFEGEKVYSFQ